MPKMKNIPKQPYQKYQQGKVSLQNVFWVIGIIVGILTIAQFVLTLIDKQSDSETDTPASTEVNPPSTTETVEESSKPTLPDSPSIKVGNYTAYDNGVVVDETLGIMWMRCSLGQEWDGTDCIGSADTYSLDEAKLALEQVNKVSYVGLSGWQVPDIEALHSLLYCSEGFEDSYEIIVKSGDTKTVAVNCAGNYIKPAIKANVFPNTYWSVWNGYWSSSQDEAGKPLVIYFNTGKIEAENGSHYVRAMRYMN